MARCQVEQRCVRWLFTRVVQFHISYFIFHKNSFLIFAPSYSLILLFSKVSLATKSASQYFCSHCFYSGRVFYELGSTGAEDFLHYCDMIRSTIESFSLDDRNAVSVSRSMKTRKLTEYEKTIKTKFDDFKKNKLYKLLLHLVVSDYGNGVCQHSCRFNSCNFI